MIVLFDDAVSTGLGVGRARRAEASVDKILNRAKAAPQCTDSITYLPIPLTWSDYQLACRELDQLLFDAEPDVKWVRVVSALNSTGQRTGRQAPSSASVRAAAP